MDLGLRGKKALITGASRGIGRACAEVLASEGCDVVIVSRTQADLGSAKDRILGQSNVSVRSYAMDLSDSRNADKLAAECPDIDILINNAGAIPRGTIAEIDEARWREAWDLKVFGYINMCRRFYALMAARRSGVIVNIIGAAGEAVMSNYACGSAGNASLMGFTRALGGTAPNDGVRVVGLNPGPVETDRMVNRLHREATAKFGDAERWRELTSHMAFGRAATATEIANMAAFLASDRSGYTTGTIVTVDGVGTSRASAF
jgi:3-oxoacyl-[acyl-carrier protein] reductase